MSFDLVFHGGLREQGEPCRLVVRKEKSLSEILQFSTAGLEIGQQVVIMAGPICLKDIAHGLGEMGLKTDALLHSGRLVFLTAPNCLAELFRPSEPFQRTPLHRHATVMRWVTDWSWVYGNGSDAAVIREYQRRLHEFIRPFNAISICPRPVRDPAHHRGVTMQRTALQGFAGAEQFGQAVGRGQEDQSSTVQQGIGLEPCLAKAVRNVFQAGGPCQDDNLLANIQSGG